MGFDLTFEKIVYIWRRLVESEKFMKRIKDIIKKNEGLNFIVHVQNQQELVDLIDILEELNFEATLPYELMDYKDLRDYMMSCGEEWQYDVCFRISECKGIAYNPSVEHFRRWYNDILEIRNGEIIFNERDDYTEETAKIEARKIWKEINKENDGLVNTLAIFGFSKN